MLRKWTDMHDSSAFQFFMGFFYDIVITVALEKRLYVSLCHCL